MVRAKFLIGCLVFVLLIPFAGFAQQGGNQMKKVVMIIAQDDFRDEELFQPKKILEQAGVKVSVAAPSLLPAKGMLGGKITPDIKINDVNGRDFDAVIFIGGMGASSYWDDPAAHKIAQDAFSSNKIVAAICIAPVTLANAGILKSKRATVWSSEAKQLKSQGAVYTGNPVEKDGNIITASGPTVATQFGEEIVRALLIR